jgi:NADH-quinone oxidoreductase subunit L
VDETQAIATSTLRLIPALPLAGFLLALAAGRARGLVRLAAPLLVGAAFAAALAAVAALARAGDGAVLVDRVYTWIAAGPFRADVAFRLDALSAVMALVVTGVGFLIHVYAVGYMAEDPDQPRFFAYLNLFTFAMLLLVLADNLLLLFVGWEGVGLCSYLLIGFWYEKDENAAAGKKAFVVNRIGDLGFVLGMLLLAWSLAGEGGMSLDIAHVERHAGALGPGTATAVALLLLLGAAGKSAQLPLHVWLPDAMAGPTPVSALIHAATMVTAGIYMIARLHVVFLASPLALEVVAALGAATALFAATIALVQTDIKKVLAYSTVSQLGYMFVALGVGAFASAIFHLMTHAFFKALLFLGAGSVIHGMSGEQDIRKMGGLRKRMPITYATFLVGALAIAGIPGFSGFFSKDEILFRTFVAEHGGPVLWGIDAFAAGLTAFYMFRLLFLTFHGTCRATAEVEHHVHESPPSMTMPLLVLAVLSLIGGYVALPFDFLWGNAFGDFLAPVLASVHHATADHDYALEAGLMAISFVVALAGIALAYVMYVANPALPARLAESARGLHDLLLNKYWVDELYDAVIVRPLVALSGWLWRGVDSGVIDGAVNGVGRGVVESGQKARRLQSGNVQHYALSLLVGALAILAFYAWR